MAEAVVEQEEQVTEPQRSHQIPDALLELELEGSWTASLAEMNVWKQL